MRDKDFFWYLAHQEELVEEYNGKHLLIKDKKVVGSYDCPLDALVEGKKNFKPGTFIIQLCTPGDMAYTRHLKTRILVK